MRSVRHDADSPRFLKGEPRAQSPSPQKPGSPLSRVRCTPLSDDDRRRASNLARWIEPKLASSDRSGDRFLEPLDALAVECPQAVANDDLGRIDGTIIRATSGCFCCENARVAEVHCRRKPAQRVA